MSVTEVQHAIAVELGTHRFDEDNLDDVNELVSVCAGLVVLDGHSNVMRLVHYTTQEYFEQNGESVLPGAQKAIAGSCLTYLLYEDFKSGWLYHDGGDDTNARDGISCSWNYMPSWSPKSVKTMLKNHPFYEYAAQHWATHTRYGMDDDVKKLFLDFARDDNKISRSAQVLCLVNDGSEILQFQWKKLTNPLSAMHVLSYLGNDELISMLLEHGFEADVKDMNSATPLRWAVYKGHKKVVELLLSSKTVDVNNVNARLTHTALFEAAANGDVEIVKLLIAREDIDVDLGDWLDRTPLVEAAKKGHITVVELLLSRDDVDINARDMDGSTVLGFAAQSPKADLARILLARADIKRVDQPDISRKTPLMHAVSNGLQEVCELFLSRKEVDVNAKDYLGQTPLMLAVKYGYQAVFELLLSHGSVNADLRDPHCKTALMKAAEAGHAQIVELLLSHGSVDVNMRSSDGSTALLYAAEAEHEQIIELLLYYEGTDVNAKDTAGNTPLYSAVALGHENVVKVLLAHAEIDLGIDENGKSERDLALAKHLAKAACRKGRLRHNYEMNWNLMWTNPRYDGRQASLELLRAAIEERSEMT